MEDNTKSVGLEDNEEGVKGSSGLCSAQGIKKLKLRMVKKRVHKSKWLNNSMNSSALRLLNTSANRSLLHRKTLTTNNRDLARTLQAAKNDNRLLRETNIELHQENQSQAAQLANLRRVAGLRDEDINGEVVYRMDSKMREMKSILQKLSEQLVTAGMTMGDAFDCCLSSCRPSTGQGRATISPVHSRSSACQDCTTISPVNVRSSTGQGHPTISPVHRQSSRGQGRSAMPPECQSPKRISLLKSTSLSSYNVQQNERPCDLSVIADMSVLTADADMECVDLPNPKLGTMNEKAADNDDSMKSDSGRNATEQLNYPTVTTRPRSRRRKSNRQTSPKDDRQDRDGVPEVSIADEVEKYVSKERRGTFVVSKPVCEVDSEDKSTKTRSLRRGTYFVPAPVNDYLDVENIMNEPSDILVNDDDVPSISLESKEINSKIDCPHSSNSLDKSLILSDMQINVTDYNSCAKMLGAHLIDEDATVYLNADMEMTSVIDNTILLQPEYLKLLRVQQNESKTVESSKPPQSEFVIPTIKCSETSESKKMSHIDVSFSRNGKSQKTTNSEVGPAATIKHKESVGNKGKCHVEATHSTVAESNEKQQPNVGPAATIKHKESVGNKGKCHVEAMHSTVAESNEKQQPNVGPAATIKHKESVGNKGKCHVEATHSTVAESNEKQQPNVCEEKTIPCGGPTIEMKQVKPGKFVFAASRKNANGIRSAIPKKIHIKSKESQLKPIPTTPAKLISIFDFHDKTPQFILDTPQDNKPTDTTARATLEALREQSDYVKKDEQHGNGSEVGEHENTSSKKGEVTNTYYLPLKTDSQSSNEVTKRNRSKSRCKDGDGRSRSRSRPRKAPEDEDYDPRKKARSRKRTGKAASSDATEEESSTGPGPTKTAAPTRISARSKPRTVNYKECNDSSLIVDEDAVTDTVESIPTETLARTEDAAGQTFETVESKDGKGKNILEAAANIYYLPLKDSSPSPSRGRKRSRPTDSGNGASRRTWSKSRAKATASQDEECDTAVPPDGCRGRESSRPTDPGDGASRRGRSRSRAKATVNQDAECDTAAPPDGCRERESSRPTDHGDGTSRRGRSRSRAKATVNQDAECDTAAPPDSCRGRESSRPTDPGDGASRRGRSRSRAKATVNQDAECDTAAPPDGCRGRESSRPTDHGDGTSRRGRSRSRAKATVNQDAECDTAVPPDGCNEKQGDKCHRGRSKSRSRSEKLPIRPRSKSGSRLEKRNCENKAVTATDQSEGFAVVATSDNVKYSSCVSSRSKRRNVTQAESTMFDIGSSNDQPDEKNAEDSNLIQSTSMEVLETDDVTKEMETSDNKSANGLVYCLPLKDCSPIGRGRSRLRVNKEEGSSRSKSRAKASNSEKIYNDNEKNDHKSRVRSKSKAKKGNEDAVVSIEVDECVSKEAEENSSIQIKKFLSAIADNGSDSDFQSKNKRMRSKSRSRSRKRVAIQEFFSSDEEDSPTSMNRLPKSESKSQRQSKKPKKDAGSMPPDCRKQMSNAVTIESKRTARNVEQISPKLSLLDVDDVNIMDVVPPTPQLTVRKIASAQSPRSTTSADLIKRIQKLPASNDKENNTIKDTDESQQRPKKSVADTLDNIKKKLARIQDKMSKEAASSDHDIASVSATQHPLKDINAAERLSVESTSAVFSDRPRRAATNVVSYKLPGLGSKLRRGDKFFLTQDDMPKSSS